MVMARRNLMGGKSLPYDAEVEWIGSTSTGRQYIDSKIAPTHNTSVDCGLSCVFNNRRVFGSRLASQVDQFECINYDENTFGFIFRVSNGWNFNFAPTLNDAYYDVHLDFQKAIVNGSTIYNTAVSQFVSSVPIFIFCVNVNGSARDYANSKFFYFKIREGSTLVFDAIPIRFTNENGVSEGAMYDRVSGQLFRNAGRNAFIIGPDKAASNGGGYKCLRRSSRSLWRSRASQHTSRRWEVAA